MNIRSFGGISLFFFLLMAQALPVAAEEFYCEVMAVEGAVTTTRGQEAPRGVVEGDLLKADDVLETADEAYVDLAYDSEWNNITRVEANSKIRIRALYPTTVQLDSGGIFAKLKQLPKSSSFEVRTPTAIASVRGTEYRTTFTGGETEVYNVSDSDVTVFSVDEAGKKIESQSVILRNSQKTQVMTRGVRPGEPRRMEEKDLKPVQHARERIEGKIRQNIERGQMGRIQKVRDIESGEWKGRPRDEALARPQTRPDGGKFGGKLEGKLEGKPRPGDAGEPPQLDPAFERKRREAMERRQEEQMKQQPEQKHQFGQPGPNDRQQNQPGANNPPNNNNQNNQNNQKNRPAARQGQKPRN